MKTPTLLLLLILAFHPAHPQADVDARVKKFLQEHRGDWHDLNVPFQDGQLLHDIIVEHHYQYIVEIGTSTGHSTVWLAWAASKTGGKVITMEMDRRRQKEAIKNLEEAGLSAFVEFRLGNAHDLVKQIPAPVDFVFSDADKDWYLNYFKELSSKLSAGGCYTTHNVADGQASPEYLNHVNQLPDFTTTIDRSSRAGVMISYKKK